MIFASSNNNFLVEIKRTKKRKRRKKRERGQKNSRKEIDVILTDRENDSALFSSMTVPSQ